MDKEQAIQFIKDNAGTIRRIEICTQCPSYTKGVSLCRECGCIMRVKVLLPNARCPLGKW